MKRRTIIRRSSTLRRRSDTVSFDEFGFACTKRKDQKLHHRCHDYSYPQLNSVRVKELCELLSYWNGDSFICKSQIERFIKMGIPPNLRGRVWKCLLSTDSLRESSDFNYQKCLSEVRGPLVDLGVSEYGILSAIATLSDTQNNLDPNHQQPSKCPEPCCSVDDITLFRQIALDLQRSFPTHRSLMGNSPEAIEGQAKLFRVLTAYAKYNPQVGYSQGMSYIAAVLLMQMGEEEAFWAMTALLDNSKYLAELFDLSLTKVQHQVKVFDQFLKHRKPQLYQHMESVGILSVHFVMPWFLTLFTSLPCWDSVLAVWDVIILHGLSAVFRSALSIIELLEPVLLNLNDEGAVLPLLLRVPVDVAQYTVLVPALWNTDTQDWELKCMHSLVVDDSHHNPKAEYFSTQKVSLSIKTKGDDKENLLPPSEGEKSTAKDSSTGTKSVLSRWIRLAHRYLLDPMSRPRVEKRNSRERTPTTGWNFRSQTSASLTQTLSRRQSQQKGGAHKPVIQGSYGDVSVATKSVTDVPGAEETDRPKFIFKRTCTGPVVKVARCRSNHSIVQPIRVKSFRLSRNKKNMLHQDPTSVPFQSSTLPPSSSIQSSSLPSPNAAQSRTQQKQHHTPRTALIKGLSSRRQTGFPFRNARKATMT